jgi:hypothetical protein
MPSDEAAPQSSSVAVEPDSELARAIEAGLMEYDAVRRMWVPKKKEESTPST